MDCYHDPTQHSTNFYWNSFKTFRAIVFRGRKNGHACKHYQQHNLLGGGKNVADELYITEHSEVSKHAINRLLQILTTIEKRDSNRIVPHKKVLN